MARAGAARIRIQAQPTRLERLAIVFADPLRLKIVTELHRRPMSVSEFCSADGDRSFGSVDYHFKKLTEHGWIRRVHREKRGSWGRPRHVYRAPELAIFDNEMWKLVPAPLKAEYSWRTFEQFAERVTTAQAFGTFDAKPDRYFTWSPLEVDEPGRAKVIALVDALFWSMLEEQADATIRLRTTEQRPIHTTLGIAAFDSPTSNRDRNRAGVKVPAARSHEINGALSFLPRIATVLGDSLCMKIVGELHKRQMSPTQFAGEFGGGSFLDIERRFKLLADCGWLTIVEEKSGGRRRGATEHFYRTAERPLDDTRQWSVAPKAARSTHSWALFEQIAEQVREAMASGTFDARPDRHFTWISLALDQRGWCQVIDAFDRTFREVLQEQAAASERLLETGQEAVFATVYLAAFESPIPPTAKELAGPALANSTN